MGFLDFFFYHIFDSHRYASFGHWPLRRPQLLFWTIYDHGCIKHTIINDNKVTSDSELFKYRNKEDDKNSVINLL